MTITVLFADIRSFTSMTQKMLPHEVIELLNTCMTKISRVIDEYGGVIDKYVGDEVMALFGAPIASEENALHAVKCAVKILEVLGEWNRERQGQGLIPIEMGIGVHTGLVVAGNMGAENRLNYTVLGRNVNLAARLCAAAHRMQILISDDTLHGPHVEEHLIYEKQTAMTLKGFDQPIDVYLVKGLK
jgi:adenylate cyclase